MARDTQPPDREATRAARDRPVGVGAGFGDLALQLFEMGYQPLPILPGQKRPALSQWNKVAIDEASLTRWVREHGACGIGLRTGSVIAVDIDCLDADLAWRIERTVRDVLGDTPLLRVGLWPKRLLVYRTDAPFSKLKLGSVEILCRGQQFVAFGRHPATGRDYYWPSGETPLDVPVDDLPMVTEEQCHDCFARIAPLLPDNTTRTPAQQRAAVTGSDRPVRDETNRVIDGRDGWLSSIAYHTLHDALNTGAVPEIDCLAARVWQRFENSTELERPKGGSAVFYSLHDARTKIRDKLRLHADGRLPPRESPVVEADHDAPSLTVEAARTELDRVLADACATFLDWHRDIERGEPPRIGVRATVGLGKSAGMRKHVRALQNTLRSEGLPHRVLILTPSHALAEEMAASWEGQSVAVLTGYHAKHASGEPMCRDLPIVEAAIRMQKPVAVSCCRKGEGRECRYYAACLKQENVRAVREADIVVAAYDTLFTGFDGLDKQVGLVVVDEGCWQRALQTTRGLHVETLLNDPLSVMAARNGPGLDTAEIADLHAFRSRLFGALEGHPPGAVRRNALQEVGLTAKDCQDAAATELKRVKDVRMSPGLNGPARQDLFLRAGQVERSLKHARLWSAFATLLTSEAETDGRVRVGSPHPESGLREISVTSVKPLHYKIRRLPMLHLDATLRPDLAEAVLGPLQVHEIEAAQPHMSLTLFTGSFGKGTLCPDPHVSETEPQRHRNRLKECVTHVRWHARRVSPGRVLVVTYKDCEDAFADIPGVEIAHFNAIAGLDEWRDVALLVIVGRPLPSTASLAPLVAGFLGTEAGGNYVSTIRGVRMRDGSARPVQVIRHPAEEAELLRAAICDDEVLQAIGRGRGVNRTADTPLEVHVLADVALTLVHDRVLAWDMEKPDIVQRMLLGGIAVTSPADALALHPELFGSLEQAKSAIRRSAFKGQTPIRTVYREMTLKSARYKRPGRGRSWELAYWLDGGSSVARRWLEAVVGSPVEWEDEQ